jgi:hypothetical protein
VLTALIALMMGALNTSETSAKFYEAAPRNSTEDSPSCFISVQVQSLSINRGNFMHRVPVYAVRCTLLHLPDV